MDEQRYKLFERNLWAIYDALQRNTADDPEKTLRVISQRVAWALDGLTPPDGQAGAEILGAAAPHEDERSEVRGQRSDGHGFAVRVSADRPCNLSIEVLHAEGGQPAEAIDLPGAGQSGGPVEG